MTTKNMGTPANPEGLPHWTGKSLLGVELRKALKEDRAVMVGFFEKCDKCDQSQWDDPAPTFENLLEGVVAVGIEENYGNYRPDIILHRDNAPLRIIEVVDTSEPQPRKLAFYRKESVDVFKVVVHTRKDALDLAYSRSMRLVDAVVVNDCRWRQRARLQDLMEALNTVPDATFGVKQMGSRSFTEAWAKIDPASYRDYTQALEKNREYFEIRGMRGSSSDVKIDLPPDVSEKVERAARRLPTQQYVVAGRTVSRYDLLSVMTAVRFFIGEFLHYPHAREIAIHTLFEMQAVMRHQNGKDHEGGSEVRELVDWPIGTKLLYESARNSHGDVLFYYERIFFPQSARARFLSGQ